MSEVTLGELGRRIDRLTEYIDDLPDRLDAKFVQQKVFDVQILGVQGQVVDLKNALDAIEDAQAEAKRDQIANRRWRWGVGIAGASLAVTGIGAFAAVLH